MKTLIINYEDLSHLGGIQTIIYDIMKFMSEHNVRVLWMKKEKSLINDSFKRLIYNNKIKIINVSANHIYWFKHDRIEFDKDEEIIIVSYTIFDQIKALSLKNKYINNNIICLYTIPDTTGKYFYIERYFNGWLNKYIYNRIRNTIKEWDSANLILFCDPLQITYLEKNYNIRIDNHEKKLKKLIYSPPLLNEKELEERSKRKDKFNIITVGRFDFPHKGYMLGLIRSFERLKYKYPQLTLTIIGYGHHENILREEINQINNSFKNDINVIGETAYEELPKFFKKMHLSVAVAGAAVDASRFGILSLVARNHCSGECEVYGFLPEKLSSAVSRETGFVVDSYIIKAINMSDSEYKQRCVNAYNVICGVNDKNTISVNPWYLFDFAKLTKEYKMSSRSLNFYKFVNYLRKLLLLFRKINTKEKIN